MPALQERPRHRCVVYGCCIGHAGGILAGWFVENHRPQTYARVL
jgi:hypothetical protein